MSLAKEDFISRIRGIIQDNAEFLEPDDLWRFLDQSVLIFSKDRPMVKVCEITGDGSTYDWKVSTYMTDWVENFSFIKGEIEYPANDYQTPQYVDRNSWIFYKKLLSSVTTLYLRTTGFTMASSKIMRFEYTAPHTLDETTNTINEGDSEAVINLAAALCYWALASKFAQNSDSTIDADSVDYQRKSDLYIELAKERVKVYNTLIGIGEETKATASSGIVVKDLDISYPGSIGDYLTHPSSTR